MTYPVAVMPDATAVALSSVSDLGPTGSIVPTDYTEGAGPLIVIRRVGGIAASRVSDRPTLAVECYGDLPEDAMDLAALVRHRLHTLRGDTVDGVAVYRVTDVAGPADFPDPVTRQPRVTFTIALHLRGAAPVDSA